jgi:hypothetical protein
MRTLNDREKLVIRFAAIGVVIYLILFVLWTPVSKRREEYQGLVKEASALGDKARSYQDKVLVVKKLMDEFHMDPVKLSRSTVVGEASAAIQKAAAGSGIQVGPVKESFARAAAKELASVQFEGTGPLPAVMGLLNRLETLGYPLVIDQVQITQENSKPGQLKISLTIIVLDFNAPKTQEVPHA